MTDPFDDGARYLLRGEEENQHSLWPAAPALRRQERELAVCHSTRYMFDEASEYYVRQAMKLVRRNP